MKIVLELKDSQIQRAKLMRSANVAAVMVTQKEEMIEEYLTNDGKKVRGYYDSTRLVTYLLMTGGILGFVPVRSGYIKYVVDVNLNEEKKQLIVEGNRVDIQRSEIMQSLKKILGEAWRIVPCEIFDDEIVSPKLYWWEDLNDYYAHRADWHDYYNWLLVKVDGEKGIEQFHQRFREANDCLKLLKAGLVQKAKDRFGIKLAEQILRIA